MLYMVLRARRYNENALHKPDCSPDAREVDGWLVKQFVGCAAKCVVRHDENNINGAEIS